MTTDFAGGDIGDRSTFSNSSQPMTALDPLARVREMREFLKDGRIEDCNDYVSECLDALEAVLAIEKHDFDDFEGGDIDQEWLSGYNQARDEFRSAIEKALEGRG